MPGSDEDVPRLIAVIERQQRELDRIRAAAAGQSVIAMARGALMERLGLSPAEAARQLAELSAATGMPSAEVAAAVLSSDEPHMVVDGPGPRGGEELSRGHSGRRSILAEAAAELAADGAELAGALAGQVLAPLGAAAVVLWLLEADGTLSLLGETGLSGAEASRWRCVPPQLDCPDQRVARGGPDVWWPAGRPETDGAPVIGPSSVARAVLALRERDGDSLGVMSVTWPGPLAEFSTEVRQHLSAVAAGCARVLSSRLAQGDLAAVQPRAVLYSLLDDLADAVLALRAIRDVGGRVTDFSIDHVGPGYHDPAGRTGADLSRLTLLAAYPASVSAEGLFTRAVQVLTDGTSQHVPGGALEGDLRLARFYDGVVLTRLHEPAASPAATLLEHAERLGRLGGWEENLVSGTVRWTDSAFGLFGLRPVRPRAAARGGNPAGGSAQLRDGGR